MRYTIAPAQALEMFSEEHFAVQNGSLRSWQGCHLVAPHQGQRVEPKAKQSETRTRLAVKKIAAPAYGGFAMTAVVKWWLWVDLNHRPQHYECCALTS